VEERAPREGPRRSGASRVAQLGTAMPEDEKDEVDEVEDDAENGEAGEHRGLV